MIRPGSKEAAARVVATASGDLLIGTAAVFAVVTVRREVPMSFTRALLPESALPLDPVTAGLFGGSLLFALALAGFYRIRVMPWEKPLLATALLIQMAILALASAMLEQPLPRTVLLGVVIIEAALVPLWRFFLRNSLPVRPRATILVGDAARVQATLHDLTTSRDPRIRVIAWAGPPGEVEGVIRIGSPDQLAVRSKLHSAEEVIHVSPEASARERLDLLRIRGARGFLLLASEADALLTSSTLGCIGDLPLIEVAVPCGYGARAVVKRAMDVVIGCILALLVTPIAVAAAIAIWIDDRRPVFIRQWRVGRGGLPFAMWKFRSMTVPPEGQTDGTRVTRVGAVLRRYRIDELPQLLNVLAGDMSLVGPRPERPEIVARIVRDLPDFELRTLVRPGMAGLAQVSGKYDSAPRVKLQYDITYMCDWSLGLDLRLLFSSVSSSLSGSGL